MSSVLLWCMVAWSGFYDASELRHIRRGLVADNGVPDNSNKDNGSRLLNVCHLACRRATT